MSYDNSIFSLRSILDKRTEVAEELTEREKQKLLKEPEEEEKVVTEGD